MKWENRNVHRDVAYFYIGLVIAFSFSGIILNHRADWYPMDYTYETKDVLLELPSDKNAIDSEKFMKGISTTWDLDAEYDSHRINDNDLRVFYKDNIVLDADLNTGKGVVEYKRKTPFLGQTMFLHKTTNKFWIWYSDIFGIGMLVIAFTGMFIITKGKNTFKKRGWKLALIGLIFPVIILILFS